MDEPAGSRLCCFALASDRHVKCGEEELVRQVHTLFVRSAQQVVVYELQVQEEVEGVRQEVREVEGESKARRNAHMNMHMWMEWKTHYLSHGACARDDVQTRRNWTVRAHAQTMWKSVEMVVLSLVYASCSVTTQSWTIVNMLSLVSASCIVTTHSWPILNFPLLVPISSWSQFQLVTCSQFQLIVRLYELIVTFSCSHFVHTFAPRKHVIWGVVLTDGINYIRRKNISLVQYQSNALCPIETILGEEPASSLLCGFAFAFDWFTKYFTSRCNAWSSSWSSGSSVSFLFKFITNLFDSWETLTKEWVLSLFNKFWSQLHIYHANNWLQLQIRAQIFGVPLDPSFRLWCWFFFGKVYSRQATARNCESSAHLSSWNTVHSPQHSEILHPYRICSICLVVRAFQFVLHIAAMEALDWPGHHNPKVLLSWSHSARVRNLIAPSQHVSPFFHEGFRTLHTFLRLLRKTEWICRNNYAKNSLNRFQIGCIVYRQFTTSFASTSGLVARKIGQSLSANSPNIFSARLSHTPCGLSSFKECHFFSEPGPINDHCPYPNLFAYRETSLAFARHSFSLSFDPQEKSLNIDINMILPIKFSSVSSNLTSKRLTSSLSCNVLNPGKYFTGIPLARRRFCPSFCIPEMIWTIPVCLHMHH